MLQGNFREEEELCEMFKEERYGGGEQGMPKSQGLHYLTEPEIKMQQPE